MDEMTKDYMLDTAMASIATFKEAIDVVNYKHVDKTKRLTPAQKIKHLSTFIDKEYNRVMNEYEECLENNKQIID